MKNKVLIFLTIFIALIITKTFFDKEQKNIIAYRTYQYIAINKEERIKTELTLIDYKKILNSNSLISLIGKREVLSVDSQIFHIKELSTDEYNVYKLVITLDDRTLQNDYSIFEGIAIKSGKKDYQLPIGTVTVEKNKVNNLPKDINIMSTLFSTDGSSYNLIVENYQKSDIIINNLYYDILYNGKRYGTNNRIELFVPQMTEEECNVILEKSLSNQNIVIRPKIYVWCNGKIYETLSHACIFFNTSITQEQIDKLQ